jgi:hypothetical protein
MVDANLTVSSTQPLRHCALHFQSVLLRTHAATSPSVTLAWARRKWLRTRWGPATTAAGPHRGTYLRLPPDFGAAWLSAEPVAVFEALLVRPSRSTLEAAFAAFAPVLRPAITITSLPASR